MEHVIPTDEVPKREAELGYYQWVPIILLFMSLLFKIPRIIWKVLTFSTAINLDKVSIVFEPPRGITNNAVLEQIRHKPACTATEAG